MKSRKLVFLVIFVVGAALFLVYSALFTNTGSRLITERVISGISELDNVEYQEIQGTLESGLTVWHLEVRQIKNLPEGSVLRVQKLFIKVSGFRLGGLEVEIENARLKLPDSDPVIAAGSFNREQLDLNVYSNGFTVTEVVSYLPDLKSLIPLTGEVSDIDLYITGHFLEPMFKGTFVMKQFVYKGFILNNVPTNIDLQLRDINKEIELFGSVNFEKGELLTKRVKVNLDQGDLYFSGPWDEPRLNLKGSSKIEKTKIKIVLKGTVEKPELNLTSEPPFSRQKLMVMLATGKSWQSVEDSMEGGMDSAALTKDFVDYFLFAGRTTRFAKRFGISDFSVTYKENQVGVSATKEITNKLEVGYGVEQTKNSNASTDVSQTLEGQYKVTDTISVGLEREIKKTQSPGTETEETQQTDDKVMIKYKKSF